MGSVLGGSKPKGSSSSSETVVAQVPEWLNTQNQGLVTRAADVSNQPFTPYTGNRVADFNADNLAAFQNTRDAQGRFDPLINQAVTTSQSLNQRALTGPTSEDISRFTNPFLEQVLGINRRVADEEYLKQVGRQKQDVGMVGAFGGSRMAIREGNQFQDYLQSIKDSDYTARFDAYNQALGQYNQQTKDIGGSLESLLRTALGGQESSYTDINALSTVGEMQRGQQQQEEDFNYDEFDRKNAYPYEQLNFLASILNPLTGAYRGQTTTGSGSSSSSGGSGSPLGTIAGIASIGKSIFSDERVKENIKEVGKLDDGQPIYKYNYKGDDATQIGLLAQDVEKTKPGAVSEVDGVKMVDYDKATKFAAGGKVSRESSAKEYRPTNFSFVQPGRNYAPNLPAPQKNDILGSLGSIASLFGSNPLEKSAENTGDFLSSIGLAKEDIDSMTDEELYDLVVGPEAALLEKPERKGIIGKAKSYLGFADGGAITREQAAKINRSGSTAMGTSSTGSSDGKIDKNMQFKDLIMRANNDGLNGDTRQQAWTDLSEFFNFNEPNENGYAKGGEVTNPLAAFFLQNIRNIEDKRKDRKEVKPGETRAASMLEIIPEMRDRALQGAATGGYGLAVAPEVLAQSLFGAGKGALDYLSSPVTTEQAAGEQKAVAVDKATQAQNLAENAKAAVAAKKSGTLNLGSEPMSGMILPVGGPPALNQMKGITPDANGYLDNAQVAELEGMMKDANLKTLTPEQEAMYRSQYGNLVDSSPAANQAVIPGNLTMSASEMGDTLVPFDVMAGAQSRGVPTQASAPTANSEFPSLLQTLFQTDLKQPERITELPEDQKTRLFGREVNMPLLMFGLNMLGTQGDFADQLKAGAGAFGEYNSAEKQTLQGLNKQQEDSYQKNLDNLLNRVRVGAELQRVLNPGSGKSEIEMLKDLAEIKKIKAETELKGILGERYKNEIGKTIMGGGNAVGKISEDPNFIEALR